MKEAMIENLETMLRESSFRIFASLSGFDEKDKQKISAYRQLARELGMSIGQVTLNRKTGVASGPITKEEQEESQEQKSWRLRMHGKSIAGSRHPRENQDSIEYAYEFGIAVVADGVSVSRNPREASSFAARETFELLKELQYDMNPADAGFAMGRVIHNVNKSVIEEGDGGKTTVVAAKFFRYDRDLCVAVGNVGDSRAYLLRGNRLRQLTIDDNPSEAKNVLLQCLGDGDKLDVHTMVERLQEGDKILLCSDGAYGPFDREHIVSILKNPEGDDPASALVRYAQPGTDDDISAIVIEVGHISQRQESPPSSIRPPVAMPPPVPVRNEVVEVQFREMDEAVPQPAAANDGAKVNSQNGQDQKKPRKKSFWERLGDLMDTGNGW